MTAASPQELTSAIRSLADELPFDLVGIAPAVQPTGFHPLLQWIANGYHGDMQWIPDRRDAYRHPDGVLPGTRTVVMVAQNYGAGNQPVPGARIARYALGPTDYHDTLRKHLKTLQQQLRTLYPNVHTRVIVDTAPLLERDFARQAGLGWQGKNTMLISRKIGSYFFLGALLLTAEAFCDEPEQQDYCGTCTACLDACPTNAFPEAGILDASRCISYLTIERRSATIAADLMPGMQDWVFGCDICQEVCPWNRFAPASAPKAYQQRPEINADDLDVQDLLSLDNEQFRRLFRKTALERTGRDVLVRNAAIAAANCQRHDCRELLEELTNDGSALVRDAATWAISHLGNQPAK